MFSLGPIFRGSTAANNYTNMHFYFAIHSPHKKRRTPCSSSATRDAAHMSGHVCMFGCECLLVNQRVCLVVEAYGYVYQ